MTSAKGLLNGLVMIVFLPGLPGESLFCLDKLNNHSGISL